MSTTKNVPLRLAFSVEVPGTSEQVWAAIATTEGLSSWFLPTDVEQREGGAIVVHMGETDSPGTITGWDPPRRLEYAEPEWATLGGHERDSVTPLVSEFIVEALSGGTCVVRVVSSSFGTGADWEEEFMADMAKQWVPFFDNLRLYLTHFADQRATWLEASAAFTGSPEAAMTALRDALGAGAVGDPVDAVGVSGRTERADHLTLVRVTNPVPGLLAFYAFSTGESTIAVAQGWFFTEEATGWVERAQPEWKAWLEALEPVAATV